MLKRLYQKFFSSKDKQCPVCGHRFSSFTRLSDDYWRILDRYGMIHSPFQIETLNWLEYSCPKCSSPDRDRLYALYLSERKQIFPSKPKVLDFAPTKGLSTFLKSWNGINYRSADLFMSNVDDTVDIQNMTIYDNDSFDLIICSHVLEHVPNDKEALKEIHRILKPGGEAILMAPISLALDCTLEDQNKTTIEERWKYFGQDDHLRFYSKNGFRKIILNAGFKLSEKSINDFGKNVFDKNGIHERSILYIGTK